MQGSQRLLRGRRRSFSGGGAWASGGVGSWARECRGRESATEGRGVELARSDWRERQVVMMLLNGVWEYLAGGLAGGEKKDG